MSADYNLDTILRAVCRRTGLEEAMTSEQLAEVLQDKTKMLLQEYFLALEEGVVALASAEEARGGRYTLGEDVDKPVMWHEEEQRMIYAAKFPELPDEVRQFQHRERAARDTVMDALEEDLTKNTVTRDFAKILSGVIIAECAQKVEAWHRS